MNCNVGAGENCSNCPGDCGACPPACGDNTCNVGLDTCANCPQDCGVCPPVCGDGTCNGNETCGTCKVDCLAKCTPCPCKDGDPNFDNVCHWPPNTPNCPPTAPGGYCDPNGDGKYDEPNADWDKGYYEYHDKCL